MLIFSTYRSAPEFSAGGGVGTKRKVCLQALEPPAVLESPRVQLLDPLNESEVEMFLQPPDEDLEKEDAKQQQRKHPVISEEVLPHIQEEDGVKDKKDIKGDAPIKGVNAGSPIKGAITITVDDSSGVSISKECVRVKEEGNTPTKVENENKDGGAVVRREGASERRQLRRIRTNSQVETII